MRPIYIMVFLSALLICSCTKEDAIIPTSQNSVGKYDFPENTKFDDITLSIFEKSGVQIFWTKVKSLDINRDWITNEISGAKRCRVLSEKQAEESINFLNDYIFSKIDAVFFNNILKPYVYIVDDLHKPTFGTTLMPLNFELTGIDCWVFSFFGEGEEKYPSYKTALNFLPETDDEIFTFRKRIFFELFTKMIKDGMIKIPSIFDTDFDYITKTKYNKADAKHADFFMNRGFCGKANAFKGKISSLSTTPGSTIDNFTAYVSLVASFSREQMMDGTAYPDYTNGAVIPYGDYSKVLKYYDYVHDYILSEYGYDLKQLNSLK